MGVMLNKSITSMDDFSNLPVCFTLIVNNLFRPEDGIRIQEHYVVLLSSVTDMCVFVLHLQIMFDTYHFCVVTLSKALSAPHSTG